MQPYGFAVPTPNIQLLADQGVLFREAFCAMPTCSGSRACLLTGQGGAGNGMLGLAHRGWRSATTATTSSTRCARPGYHSALIGEQHISKDPDVIGYDEVVTSRRHHASEIAPSAIEMLAPRRASRSSSRSASSRPTASFSAPTSVRDTLYSLPAAEPARHAGARARTWPRSRPAPARSTRGSARCSNALHALGLADDTLIICTTDHGLAFPGAKATLYDRGTGVMLIMRGPAASRAARSSTRWCRHLDVYPTSASSPASSRPAWLEGTSLHAAGARRARRRSTTRSSPR